MVCFATKYRFSTSNDVKALISHASSLEVDFKCQYKTDYVAGGADVLTLPDIIDDSSSILLLKKSFFLEIQTAINQQSNRFY